MQITLLGGVSVNTGCPHLTATCQWLRNLPATFITKNRSVSNAKATCPSLDVSSHSPATPWLCHRRLVLHYKLSSGRLSSTQERGCKAFLPTEAREPGPALNRSHHLF